VNGEHKALDGINVLLLQAADSAVVRTAVSADGGRYEIGAVPAGNYLLKVAGVGYVTNYTDRVAVGGDDVTVPVITVSKTTTALKEVSVTAQKPFIEVKADKLVLNVENSIVSAGSNVLEVLSRAPGVTVGSTDRISLKGKQGVTIMIDGRIQPLGDEELANLLRSMSAKNVDKIEIISNPSAKYDAAGVSGIINIKTRKDARFGLNGSVNANFGQGFYPKGGVGANLTYRNKRWSVFTNYNYNDRSGIHDVDFYREFFTNDSFRTAYDQHNFSRIHYITHSGGAGADYKLGEHTSIGALLTINTTDQHMDGGYFSKVLDAQRQQSSYFTTDNHVAMQAINYAPNLHLQHSFDSSGKELTMDLDYAQYLSRPDQQFSTAYFYNNGEPSAAPYLLYAHISGNTIIRSLKADYTNPLKGGAHIDAGMKSSYVTADNEPRFYDRSSGVDVYDSSKSDHFLYKEYINAVYVNAGKEWTRWGLQAGLRAEQTIVNGHELITGQSFDRQYLQFFPSVDITRHINPQNDLTLTFSRRITRPNYQELNPYKFFVDPSTYKVGNPYLQPALEYAAEVSHVYKQRFVTSLSYSVTKDIIVLVVKPSTTEPNVSIQTYQNLTTLHYIGASGSYNMSLRKWWSCMVNANAYYSRYVGNISNTELDNGIPSFDFYSNNTFILPRGFTAELSGNYSTAQVYGYLNMRPQWAINAGVQKSFLDKKLTAKLSFTDIFYKNVQHGSSTFTDYTQTFKSASDTRQLIADISYRFGKKSVGTMRLRKGGAEEEKRRIGG
jgi:hypothetical protein